MDIDLPLREDEPPIPMESSTQSEKDTYEKWERSNRLSLIFMQSHVSKSIRGFIPQCTKAKDFIKVVEEQFVSHDKALASTLMQKLSSIKLDNTKGEHIMEMRDIATQLKSLEIEMSESFLVYFILNSVPNEYVPFKISYNTHKEKWSLNELLTMCVKKEERLKHEKLKSAYLTSHVKGNTQKSKSVPKDKEKQVPIKKFSEKD
ncbi:uncharacterized protein LOC112099945 [Citrus clementina]|uniref:uncharacterized protein LOC112099945 n=1 Tax=Citrus clementina TaxID=85681 RepID=UPI000CED489A|nr:uncharacterized protein LOC112099945 [Citrus x clementina]